jgi:hypothetical protein
MAALSFSEAPPRRRARACELSLRWTRPRHSSRADSSEGPISQITIVSCRFGDRSTEDIRSAASTRCDERAGYQRLICAVLNLFGVSIAIPGSSAGTVNPVLKSPDGYFESWLSNRTTCSGPSVANPSPPRFWRLRER